MQKQISYKLNVDPDTILNKEEQIMVDIALRELKEGKNQYSLEDIKRARIQAGLGV